MKIVICLLTLVCLAGCVQNGYSPSYIISDASEDVSNSAPETKGL